MPGRIDNAEAESSRRKRPRVTILSRDDDEEEEILEVQQASSNLRGESQRKRARISEAESFKESRRRIRESADADFNDGAENEVQQDDPPSSPPKTQYDALRDGNFEHLQHELEDDQRATQRLRFRPNLLGDNAVADNGILESITCINFMCHTRLHCELGPLLNFIVGENGSGKSAILTAITLCLGGKASSTNRGGSLKSFVKEGTERSILAVKIKNQGQDAYKHDIYGDSIMVERHFSKQGSSGFKIKTALGQTISTKRQEIEDIVEYFALQVDNPLNVLSQDNARQFLNASTKTQKYKFFIDGVQLQQLDNDYRLINESLEQMMSKVPDQEERVKQAEAKVREAKQKKEAVAGTRKLKVKMTVLAHQIAWAQVIAEEKELEERKAKLSEARNNIAAAEQKTGEKRQILRVADEKLERNKELIEAAQEEVTVAQQHVDEEGERFKALREEVEKVLVEEREAHSNLKTTIENIQKLEAKIKAEEQRLADANGEAHSLKLRELEEAKTSVQDVEKAIEDHRLREPELANQHVEAKKKLDALGGDIQRKRGEISAVEEKIRRLQSNMGDPLDGYEANVPRLLQAIQNDKRFRDKPIGPLGTHIRLLQPQWSGILEQTFGRTLSGFIVTSSHDSKILHELMNRNHVRDCPVFLTKQRAPLDLRGKEPEPEFDTVLRVLKIDNDMVRDQLIINSMIEQVVLVPERAKAEAIMFSGAPPRNVKAVICFQDGRRDVGLRLTENNGLMGTSPIQSQRAARPRMLGDSAEIIAFEKGALRTLETEYRAIESDKRRLQQEVQRCSNELAKHKKDRNNLNTRLRHAQVAVTKVEEDLDQFEGVDGRLQGLQNQLEEQVRNREHHGIQYGTLNNRKKERNAELEKAQAKFKEIKVQFRDCEARLVKVEDKRRRLEDTRSILLRELNEAEGGVSFSKQEADYWGKKVAKQTERRDQFIKDATVAAPSRPHVPPDETTESLEKQYETLEKQLKKMEKQQGMTEQEVNELLAKTMEAHKRAKADLESILAVNRGLKQTLQLRLTKWRLFQRFISSQSRCNFQYLLSERGFRGKLLFDHHRKSLDLQVEPDKTERRAQGRSTKTLSGGEKSFSSICLLLAIWEAMGSPLRCLDEFDVFMDNVNRAISTNMLITAARRSVNRQYIFITPNAIEGRNTLDKDVKIIRLTDPRQRTLADH